MAPRVVAACAVVAVAACGYHPPRVGDDAAVADDDATPPSDGGSDPNIFATANGTVDVFINGAAIGSTTSPGSLLAASQRLVDGANAIVLRARSGGGSPFALAQIGGMFGKAGTSAQWKAKPATTAEATEPIGPWAAVDFDDSGWGRATDVGVEPSAPFPDDGPARGIWTAGADSVVLLRLRLYAPPGWSPAIAQGFGRDVFGGTGGDTITVTTPAALVAAVAAPGPKLILVAGTIDFTGTEGSITSNACLLSDCSPPTQNEYIVDKLGACDGKPTAPFTYDKAGTTPLAVGSDTSIVGIGANATIRGKGLSIAHGAHNVMIENLTIADINPQIVWGGDAIHIDDASDVWIDHVRFLRIARQMIVTGFGAASNVTLSWNEFDGRTPYASFCNGAHFWLMLFLGSADTITVANNWIHDTSGRGPHAGGSGGATNTIQLVNNDYDGIPGVAAQPITATSRLLFEGTYFRAVTTPFQIDPTTPGRAFAALPSTVASTTAACTAALGRPCVANIAAPQNGAFPLDQPVLDAFSSVASDRIIAPFPADEVPNSIPHLAGPGHR
jgi:pectate lyase